ncbi:MAG: NADPH-dependent 7-cyano-7-deazaguanine reductase QueF [Gammaproteobacteria bacterium]|nr:NADPH-dependent 7-cyano-7-deazaguanine reductase QueF [Gammaproteobacteria bacterium]
MNPRELLMAFTTILLKEVRRFVRIWPQTLVPPAITVALYYVIFGSLIGSRIGPMGGFDYMQFVVPGLIMMAVITNSYANVVSSFFGAKYQHSIEELLVSPTPNYIILLGFTLGGVARGLCVGLIVTVLSLGFVHLQVQHLALTVLVVLLTAVLFSLAGLINAVHANNFDDVTIIPTFVLTPLIYLGGVFYSIDLLPAFWRALRSRVSRWFSSTLAAADLDTGMSDDSIFADTPLGKRSEVVSQYTPSLLVPVARERLRQKLLIEADKLPFEGADLWTAWELTWVDRDGKPEVGVAQLRVPCNSRAVFESKSLKLYLQSFSQTAFASAYDVVRTLELDLSVTVGTSLVVNLLSMSQAAQAGVATLQGECLDTLKLKMSIYRPDPGLLELVEDGQAAGEIVYSNLFRTVCPVTGQPDIASIQVNYFGTRIDQRSLLRYLVSYREYEGFHEHCVERIFIDIMDRCRPRDLSVYARYTRRGGIDINPFRSTGKTIPPHTRLARQ